MCLQSRFNLDYRNETEKLSTMRPLYCDILKALARVPADGFRELAGGVKRV